MSPPDLWGPPVWLFIHTLAEKINENDFKILGPQLFTIIKRICSYLPCPDCSSHATMFLSKVKPNQISCKTDFKNMLYFFHNSVNKRKGKPLFPYNYIEKYKKINVIRAYNHFLKVYHTKGNLRMLTESFQRSLVIKDLKKWLLINIKSFQ